MANFLLCLIGVFYVECMQEQPLKSNIIRMILNGDGDDGRGDDCCDC